MRFLTNLFATSVMILMFTSKSPAVDLLYVSMGNNTIVSYDTTSNNGATIATTESIFASTNLIDPYGIAFDSLGNLYAANLNNNYISKFNSSGVFQSTIGSPLNLNAPIGLAFDSSDNLYAANRHSGISKFNSYGIYIDNISANLGSLTGLAFDSSGNLYASNTWGSSTTWDTISKFDTSGNYIGNIASHLSTPMGIAIDSSDNLYSANANGSYNTTISKFNSSGVYLSSITSSLTSPFGLAIDSLDNIYATNWVENTISKFDSSGNFLTSWSTGTHPASLAFKPITAPEPSTYILVAVAACTIAIISRQTKSNLK